MMELLAQAPTTATNAVPTSDMDFWSRIAQLGPATLVLAFVGFMLWRVYQDVVVPWYADKRAQEAEESKRRMAFMDSLEENNTKRDLQDSKLAATQDKLAATMEKIAGTQDTMLECIQRFECLQHRAARGA